MSRMQKWRVANPGRYKVTRDKNPVYFSFLQQGGVVLKRFSGTSTSGDRNFFIKPVTGAILVAALRKMAIVGECIEKIITRLFLKLSASLFQYVILRRQGLKFHTGRGADCGIPAASA